MNSDDIKVNKRKIIATTIKTVGLESVITNFKNILDAIWTNVFKFIKLDRYKKPRVRTCPGIIASINTLNGINELCEIEDYPDAYLLIRKLRDNLFLDLFLFEAQKVFEKMPSSSFKDIDFNNIDETMKMLDDFFNQRIKIETTREELEIIDKWKTGQLLMSNSKDKKEYFQFDKYREYLISNNNDFSKCYYRFLKERFSTLGLKLNDYTHSNSETIMTLKEKPSIVLNDVKETLTELEHLFLVSLFFVDSVLFSSEDYEEYIENGITPPQDSQYWVNGYILEALQDIKTKNKDLFDFMVSHNNYSMRID